MEPIYPLFCSLVFIHLKWVGGLICQLPDESLQVQLLIVECNDLDLGFFTDKPQLVRAWRIGLPFQVTMENIIYFPS